MQSLVFLVPIWLALALLSSACNAHTEPEIDYQIILGHGSGSSQDRTTRALASVWSDYLGARFTFENKKGASGRIGFEYFLTQSSNKPTLFSVNLTSASLMYAQQQPSWDWDEEFEIVGLMAIDPGAIFVRNDSPYVHLEDLINAAQSQPLLFSVGYWASIDNLFVQQLTQETNSQFHVVPSGGSSRTITDVLSGNLPVGFTKIAPLSKNLDSIRLLGFSERKGFLPTEYSSVPSVNSALDTNTILVSSYRVILVSKRITEKEPGTLKNLRTTFEQAKDDPRFIELAERAGIARTYLLDLTPQEIRKVLQSYWDAYTSLSSLY